jgi:hypothetical protein
MTHVVKSKLQICYAIISMIVFVGGCVSGGKGIPSANPSFIPKETYNVDYDLMWTKVVSTLNRNQIQITTSAKDTWQISTGYVEGPSFAVLPVAGNYSRYKYNIFITRDGPTRTTVAISPIIESSMIGSDGGSPFHDVTSANPANASRLKNWLYEQLEASMTS